MVSACIIALWRTFSFGMAPVQRCWRYFCSVSSDAFRISPVSKALVIKTLVLVLSISSLSLIFSPITFEFTGVLGCGSRPKHLVK